jgi:hypothetical protein
MRNRKYRLQKDLVFLTVSMFITVCLWIGFNIYDAYVTSTINETLQIQIIPINGKFDVDTLEQLKNRTVIQPDYGTISASKEATLPTATQIDLSTQNNIIAPTPTETNNLQLTPALPTPTTIIQTEVTPVEVSL